MRLPLKHPERLVPPYSLTGDVLSFSRCERSYRYYNGSSLPPSRPVQMWYGEFIHGMMERSFRLWQEYGSLPFPLICTPLGDGIPQPPPPDLDRFDLRTFGWPIERALAHQGKFARSTEARLSAYERATVAINELGPHLFPLIELAERRVTGTRRLPPGRQLGGDRASHYVLQGIIDVLGHAQLTAQSDGNIFKDAISHFDANLRGEFEIIADYKGARRPSISSNPRSDWQLGEWQIQTYAWLRAAQPDAMPVAAGILIYVNELSPGSREIGLLRADMRAGRTDVVPERGSHDFHEVETWRPGRSVNLSRDFRIRRAIRLVPVTDESIVHATDAIDRVVRAIEDRVSAEREAFSIRSAWAANSNEHETCVACDFRGSCEWFNRDNAEQPLEALE